MYTQFFKLQSKPFSLMPKASIFHDNSGISPAYQSLLNGIHSGDQLILFTGDTGTGKTLCAQKLLADLEQDPEYKGINIPFTSLPYDEILGYICAELNLSYGLGQNDNKLEILEMFLSHGVSPIRSVVIIIDEAQNLGKNVFSGLAKLLELGEGTKRGIQIVVMARNEADLQLSHPHMAEFSRKITHRYHLQTLSPSETISYIKYQLESAGATYSDFFTEEAAARVHDLTRGYARPINILCDQTLNFAANEKETVITVDHVNSAHSQQKFDDTIEMRTSQISDAIARYVNDEKPLNDQTPVQESETFPESDDFPETIVPAGFNSDPYKTETVEPVASIDPEILTEEAKEESKPEPQLKPVFPTEKPGGFWKVALASLAVVAIIGLTYFQVQQQKVISGLEKQLSETNENKPATEIITPAEEVIAFNDKEEATLKQAETLEGTEKIEHPVEPGLVSGPKNETVYIDHDQTQPPVDQSPSKQTPDEDNSTSEIKTDKENEELPPTDEDPSGTDVEQLLTVADFQISELKLTNPKGDNALESYHQILEMEPENVQAKKGIVSLKEMFLGWAENNRKINEIDRARNYYKKAMLVDPDDQTILQKLTELDEQPLAKEEEASDITAGLLELAKKGNADDTKILLDKGAYADIQDQLGNTPLMLATDRGHFDVVQALLSSDANINTKNKAGDTALINAVWNNQIEIADQLLHKKAKVNLANNRGWTALMYAAIHGHTDLFKKLVENGAKLESRTEDQKTPLTIAAHNGQREITSLLLENGAKVNSKDKDGWTPLMHAVWNNHPTVAQILLLNKSKTNLKNQDGWTALMLAAWNGYDAIAEMLLKHGSNRTIKNNDGNTAFDLASEQQHYSVVALLR